MSDQIHLLKSKRFLPLFITQFFGAFNDNAFKNALLIWFTYDVASSSDIDPSMIVSLSAGVFILPFFLFSALAGQIADKYEKSWLTQQIKMAEILLMIACAACFYLGSIYGLLVILFLMGVQSAFFGPIKYSLLPEHLREDELVSGNGIIDGGTFLSILLGTLFGGLIIRLEYGVEILSASVILFAIVGWFSSYYIPKAPIGDPKLTVRWNIIAQTWKIIGYARKESSVWLSIIAISWFWFIGASFLTQLPIYTKEVIGGNEHIVTLFLTIFSIGIGIGSVWCNSLLKSEINGRLVPYGAATISIAIILFFIASHYYVRPEQILDLQLFLSSGPFAWSILLSLLMLAIASGVYVVPLYAIMQHRTEERYLARVVAANNVVNSFSMVLASLFAIALFTLSFSVNELLLAVGIMNIPIFFIIRGVVRRRLSNA